MFTARPNRKACLSSHAKQPNALSDLAGHDTTPTHPIAPNTMNHSYPGHPSYPPNPAHYSHSPQNMPYPNPGASVLMPSDLANLAHQGYIQQQQQLAAMGQAQAQGQPMSMSQGPPMSQAQAQMVAGMMARAGMPGSSAPPPAKKKKNVRF